jgi:acetolactate synthase I/II/III large subunit
MKASDFITQFLVDKGVKTVFLITGGAITHVVDSIGQRKDEKGDIDFVVVQHEQAGAMAAEAYSRLASSGAGVMLATSGPGATNLVTGICGCWFDSVPGFFITGQVNSKESQSAASSSPRQVGFQETDVVSIVKTITKYAVKIERVEDLAAEMEKAWRIAHEGRPGPVLIDIPVDVQVANIELESLKATTPEVREPSSLTEEIEQVISLLSQAERPVLLLGGGIRAAGALSEVKDLVEKARVPFVVSWSGFDLLPHDHPLFAGHIGVYGERAANLVVQNADLVIAIGSRLDTRQTGGRVDSFARGAKIVMVDIDQNELTKGRGLRVDLGIVADAKDFIVSLASALPERQVLLAWQEKVQEWIAKYSLTIREDKAGEPITSYSYLRKLSDQLPEGQITISDEGGNLVWTMQSFKIKKDQRLISTFGNSPMGYALPAAMGASVAQPGKDIICIDGDGGFQMNIQELQTIAHYNLPVKIFIMNNRSMGIIKQFQDLYFGSRYTASTPEGGYSAPDFAKIAQAYGIQAWRVEKPEEVTESIERALSHSGPVLVDVWIDQEQKLNPKLEFGRPIEDMTPYIERAEFKKTMIVPILPECEELPKHEGWVTLK